ncbi:MAG TPA: autotransporter-associated beta strand repeat-containing protein, partial [Gemmataceae bacterium]
GSTVQFDSNSAANLATNNDLIGLSLTAVAVGANVPGPLSIGGNGFTLTGAVGIDMGTASQSLNVSLTAGQVITLGGNQTWRVGIGATGSNQTLTINSPIVGAANLTLGVTNQASGSSGTIQLLAVNTYSGDTVVGGPNTTYVLGTNSPFGTGTVTQSSFNSAPRYQTSGDIHISNAMNWGSGFMYTAASTGSLTFDGPITLTGNTAGQVNRTVNNASNSTVTFNGTITMSAVGDTLAKTLLLQPASGSVVVNGVVQDAVGGVVGLFTKAGAGTLTINNTTSTFGGQVALQNGVTEVTLLADQNSPSSLGSGATAAPINVGTGATAATLRYIGGTNSSTNRQLRLLGTTGGATLDASGTGTVSFTSTAFGAAGAGAKTLTLTGSNTGLNTIAGAINQNSATNNTSVTKTGPGTWNLTGANTYTGPTTVSGGTLLVNNAAGIITGAGAVTVSGATASGGPFGTLGGNGGIAPAVTVQAGAGGGGNGVIAPGASTGVSIGSLALGGGLTLPGTYTADVQTGPNANDLIAVTGNLDLTGGTLNLPATNSYDPAGAAYTLLTYTGTLTGAFATTPGLPSNYAVSYATPGQVNLVPSPVPEPAFVLLACGGLAAVARWRRTRVVST